MSYVSFARLLGIGRFGPFLAKHSSCVDSVQSWLDDGHHTRARGSPASGTFPRFRSCAPSVCLETCVKSGTSPFPASPARCLDWHFSFLEQMARTKAQNPSLLPPYIGELEYPQYFQKSYISESCRWILLYPMPEMCRCCRIYRRLEISLQCANSRFLEDRHACKKKGVIADVSSRRVLAGMRKRLTVLRGSEPGLRQEVGSDLIVDPPLLLRRAEGLLFPAARETFFCGRMNLPVECRGCTSHIPFLTHRR